MKWTKEMWAISILSDAQELLSMKNYLEVNEKINQAKKVLINEYKELTDGLTIEVN